MKKIKSIFLLFIITLTTISSSTIVYGVDNKLIKEEHIDNDYITKSNKSEFIKKTSELAEVMIEKDGTKIDIANTKKLNDFAGNTYTLVECSPIGYYIMHDESGQFIEYTPESQSPYLGYDDNLYYIGPMEYYVKKGNNYINTLDKDSIIQNADLSEMRASSIEMNANLMEYKNDCTTKYLHNENVASIQKSNLKERAKQATTQAASHTYYWANGKAFFNSRRYAFGYVDGGYCGYIASSILLQYWNYRGKIKLNSIYTKNANAYIKLTNTLINKGKSLGCGKSTWGGSQAKIINAFAKSNKFKANAGSGIGSNLAVKEIKNNKRPCILFGNIDSPKKTKKVKHAVVAYGLGVPTDWFNGFNIFVCHYGWIGYPKVYVSKGLYGSVTSYAP